MKPKSIFRSFLFLAGSSLLAISSTTAASLYWDGGTVDILTNGNGVSAGTAGNWNTALLNWDAGATAHVAWNNSNNDTAYLGGTGATVTLTAPITVGGLGFFSNSGYTIAAGTQGLTFGAATNNIRMLNVSGTTSTATIGGTVSGSNDVVLTSVAADVASTLTINGAGSGGWSGSTTINAGATFALGTTTASDAANRALLNTSAINLRGGGLTLNFASGFNNDRVNDSAAVGVTGGGTVTIGTSSASLTESLGGLTLNSGQLNLPYVNNPSSGGTITFSSFTRSGATSAMTVSSSANGVWKFTGQSNTPTDEIIGAWATTGGLSGTAAQTDYAIFTGGDGTVASRGITASAESTWSTTHSATSNYTLNNGSGSAVNGRLTATRNINSLRNTTTSTAVTATNATDVINLTGHGFVAGDVVVLGGTTAPTGLTLGIPYYVINPLANTFQLSTTSGGSAALFTTDGTAINIVSGVTLPTGFALGTNGILNGSAAAMGIGGDGGTITLPTTDAGNLYVTTGSGAINISAQITNNTGALTLVKNGTGGTLTLSGANTYTGGTVLNAGTLAIGNVANIGGAGAGLTFGGTATLAPSAALNFSTGTLTVSAGAFGTITGSGATAFATTAGSGTLRYTSGASSNSLNLGDASGFTGNLQYRHTGNANYAQGANVIQFSGLGDGVGSVLQIGGGQSDATAPGQRATITFTGGSAPLTFNNRVVEILPRIASNHTINTAALENDNATAANTWVINTNLSSQVSDARSLELSGSNTGANAFNGVISDGNNGGSILLRKDGTGTWIIAGNNTHSGGTTLTAGKLNVNNATALGTGTFTWGAATLDNTSGSAITNANNNAIAWNGDGTFSGTNSLNLGTGNVTLGGNRQPVVNGTGTLTVGGVVSGAFGITLGGAGTLALTNENSTFTGKTVVGNNAGSLKLQITKLAPLGTNSSLGAPTTAANGLIQLGSASNSSTLELTGGTSASSTDRQIQIGSSANGSGTAVIQNNNTNVAHTLTFTNPAFNVAATGVNGFSRSLQLGGSNTGDNTITGAIIPNTGTSGTTGLVKNGTGTWVLNSASSSYTGATSVQAGTLKIAKIADFSANSSIGAPTSSVIVLGNTTTTGTLIYTGSGDSSNRTFRIGTNSGTPANTDTGGGVIQNDGTGALTFTAATFNSFQTDASTGAGADRVLTLQGSNIASNTIQGVIQNNLVSGTGTGTATVGITKDGAGLWILSGSNTYTGTTAINGGTLSITGATQATSAITVGAGGSLGLDIASSVAASAATVTLGGAVTITGTPTLTSYTLLTANSITGTPVLSAAVPGYVLQVTGGNQLQLVQSGGDLFTTWSGGAAFDADANGDGVKNGLAWVLGATDKDVSALSLLPTIDNSDPTYFIFTYRRKDDANTDANTTIAAQYGTDLIGWTTAVHNGTTIIITPTDNFYGSSPGVDKVEVKIARSLAPGGKLFIRLNTVRTP